MVKIIKKKIVSREEEIKKERTKKIISTFRKQEEEESTSSFAASINFAYVDTNLIPIAEEDIKILTEKESKENNVAIIYKVGRTVSLVSTDPTQEKPKKFIEKVQKENGWKTKIFVISRSNMERIWDKYKKIVFLDILDQANLSLSDENLSEFKKELGDLVTLKSRINEMPTTEILNVIMSGAYVLKASDVHIEPEENTFRLRYRIDGVLQDVASFPLKIFRNIISRIKLMAGMKINLNDIAQDGTFKIKIGSAIKNKNIETRVSIIPGNFGESVVIRLLDPDSIKVSLESLGFRGLAAENVQKEIEAPNGMILNTGPTGSGKTTTLYAIINKLNTPEKKIITVEDPIEYELSGISQTQVEKTRGYSFANGLRAIVRQDPDIILVGEIRDDETADIAVNSALTGHLVLSSLHTNNAVGAIPRFLELGIKPSLMSPAINLIIGQRLVRKLCENCKEAYAPAKESIDSIKKIISIISPKAKVEIPKNIETLYRPVGCSKCNQLGYKGRVGIFEVLSINEEIEKLIMDLAGETDLAIAALESGMTTMLQDGILKAIEGITSIDEVQRVTGQGKFLEEIYEKLMTANLSRSITINKKIYDLAQKSVHNFTDFQKIINQIKTTELVQAIFSGAVELGTGDVHIEPDENNIKIRFRVDGILQTAATIEKTEYPNFLGEIKLLSGIKTEIRQGVVDSRFSIKFNQEIEHAPESSIDVRVSIILGGYGETVVLRLLFKSNLAYDLTQLGIRKENLDKIMEEISKPTGIILNTGPTGSGKTTTLYSILQYLNKPELKIITVEDPIEYQLSGILQTSVNEKDGYTFSTALRQLLRQNPDIMMIGEMRDTETAQTAVQAALTGHMVISTIHTNNAAGTVSRMTNMGVSPSDIATSVNAFIAQRLVRKLCDCKRKEKPGEEEKEIIKNVLKTISPKSKVKIPAIENVYHPVGCPKCNQLGYKGRMTISEVFQLSKKIKEMIGNGALSEDLEEEAIKEGMLTMTQDGILRVLSGETTLEEIKRVTIL